ncbi:Oidioi.mRNA.OKI2018_I69.chr2.g6421.t1.cds [Oikopleura dioica]|uniref:Oidioi.mRNA.OKI2018_I69.chr2.g6421.t1.cds n=1 Tax=Oikopleura dioica TaxID=34765 RepID=A0ABN7TCB7_OIKDI|nr:Oidioi.mRNA.OKI2018_I69.chr2.g6421.t1.cds [Oikopleura dioica]
MVQYLKTTGTLSATVIKSDSGAGRQVQLPSINWKISKRRNRVFFGVHGPSDILYDAMWYIKEDFKNRQHTTNILQYNKDKHLRHMNVEAAWDRGYSGAGVVVTILDDGIETDHPDLKRNYDKDASWDMNDGDDDPMLRYTPGNTNRHGTRCAGEVAATADNGICVPGIAFNAKIGGIRMLDGEVTDAIEARSLKYRNDYIDIYSVSWGPEDDGKTVDGPADLTRSAFKNGINQGRNGKGSIFVWASGNGGKDKDNCNCDGYTNLPYTIAVSSTTETENIPWYSEPCASTLTTTYSSGTNSEKQVITTDINKSCTEHHTGTSGSAPIAAGIIALTLEANPNLGWRDVQHIIVQTSKPQLLTAPDWRTNGVGREYSHRYGFGLMNAGAMVELAETWRNVPPQRNCIRQIVINSKGSSLYPEITEADTNIPFDRPLEIEFNFDCPEIDMIEHVMPEISLKFKMRGLLAMHLISPSGTNSTILGRREHDQNQRGFSSFQFLSVHFWDEDPNGTWKLQIFNTEPRTKFTGQLRKFSFHVTGTSSSQEREPMIPQNQDNGERTVQLRNSKLESDDSQNTKTSQTSRIMTMSSTYAISSSIILLILSLLSLFL